MRQIPAKTGRPRYPRCRFHKAQCLMDSKRFWPRSRKALPLAVLMVCSVSPTWPDVRLPLPSLKSAQKLRYCSADATSGANACFEMCDPARYQGHASAKSCEGKHQKARIMPPLPSHTSSKKNNKVQAASL
jgi:hypothetical protein